MVSHLATQLQRGGIEVNKFILGIVSILFALTAWAAEPVNVNSASAQEIAENLKGVGLSKANAIVAYREENGSFDHADELINVKGIGLRTVDQNRGMILLEGGEASGAD
ncbi:MAG: helix-hairpin-helix domain-containing protein [Xanthomonadales bacterium]|nr:helix-hairpin-helix domain-containing protein [Gammaproteobacteria bacterium]MBT8055322.1 helix-hairpin-helix domain-containing protein [Gammaproteobacteria bacterium]NNL05505.1 helix-hairpin-helix domain-containing protein [Xanthomonadales bacterium]